MELQEPAVTELRGTFRSQYSRAKAERDVTSKLPRLLDHVLCIAEEGDDDYFRSPEAQEFAVVDVVTREKAWFEVPEKCTPDMITGMIASTFGAAAFRVGNRLWFV